MDYPSRKCTRGCKCCITFLILIVILAVVLVVLFNTVFKVRTPTMRINSVSVEDTSGGGSLLPTNLMAATDASVKNPNYLALHFKNPNITAYYNDKLVGQAEASPGVAPARGTVRMKAKLNLNVTKMLDDQKFVDQFINGTINLNTTVLVGGKVKILGVIPHHTKLMFNCTLTIDANTFALKNQTCNQRIWFWKPRK